jgi:hypothetical protein
MKSRNVGWIQNPSLDHPELSMRFETWKNQEFRGRQCETKLRAGDCDWLGSFGIHLSCVRKWMHVKRDWGIMGVVNRNNLRVNGGNFRRLENIREVGWKDIHNGGYLRVIEIFSLLVTRDLRWLNRKRSAVGW